MRRDYRILVGAGVAACAALAMLASVGVARSETVRASFYGYESRPVTAYCVAGTCRKFHPLGLTAAHRKLPFGTRLRVSRQGHSVEVEVTDCGPYIAGRGLDLSLGAARVLGMEKIGVAPVEVEVISLGSHNSHCG